MSNRCRNDAEPMPIDGALRLRLVPEIVRCVTISGTEYAEPLGCAFPPKVPYTGGM